MECSIAGYSTTTSCGEVELQKVKSLYFFTGFLDRLGALLEASENPKITVSLFERLDASDISVVIRPTQVTNVKLAEEKKSFLFHLDLFTSETVFVTAFGQVMRVVEIISNLLSHLSNSSGLTFTANLVILNSNSARIDVNLSKQT